MNKIVALLTTETFKVYSYNRGILWSLMHSLSMTREHSHGGDGSSSTNTTVIAATTKFTIQLPSSNMTVTDVLSPRSKSIRLMHTILLFYCQHYCHIDKFITLFRQQIANAAQKQRGPTRTRLLIPNCP